MMILVRFFPACVVLVAACATSGVRPGASQQPSDSALYVAVLGQDTSYFEWLVRRGNDVRLDVVERIPRVRLLRTMLTQNADGSLAAFERRAYLPGAEGLTPSELVTIRMIGDSTIIETTGSGVATRHAARGRHHRRPRARAGEQGDPARLPARLALRPRRGSALGPADPGVQGPPRVAGGGARHGRLRAAPRPALWHARAAPRRRPRP